MLPIGDILQDRYQVEALLGSGGLADVYRVRHLALGSKHALKVLSWDRASIDRRLLLEGRIQAQLRHPNIVAVTDVLKVEGKAALLLDYVDGPTLDEFLAERDEPLPEAEALDLFAGILAAVVRAHDAGVLHRDLKPQNVLLETIGGRIIPKVADFGLAKIVEDEFAASNTRTNVTMGTPGYMAPEQVRDAASVDARTDVFALAVLLHEILTGERAFTDEAGHTTVTSTLEDEAPPLPDRVDERVRRTVEAALSHDPAGRPTDARALAELLFAGDDPRRRDVLALGGTPLALSPRQGEVAQLADLQNASLTSSSPSADTAVPATQPEDARSWTPAVRLVVLLGALGLGAAGLWSTLGPEDSAPGPLLDGPPRTPPPVVPEPAPLPAADEIAPPTPAPEAEPPGADAPPPGPTAAGVPTAPAPAPAAPAPAPTAPAPAPTIPAPVPAAPAPAAPASDPTPPDAPDAAPPLEEPPPAPAPSGTADPDPDPEDTEMVKMQRLLAGSWSGTTDRGQPLVLRIDRVDADGVRGALVFTGPTSRTTDLVGTFDGSTLRLSSDDGTKVEVTLSGSRMTGSYGKGKRSSGFSASR